MRLNKQRVWNVLYEQLVNAVRGMRSGLTGLIYIYSISSQDALAYMIQVR